MDEPPGGLAILADAYGRHPANRDILLALVTINRDAGKLGDARSYAQAIRRRYPDDGDADKPSRELCSRATVDNAPKALLVPLSLLGEGRGEGNPS